LPQSWIVDFKRAGNDDKALVCLGRDRYRGVIRENDV